MGRKFEALNKGVVLRIVVSEIVTHAIQFQQFDKHQVWMNPLQGSNLGSVLSLLCEFVNLVAIQHQVRGERILLMQGNVLVLDGNELFHGVQIRMLQIMPQSITAHHLLCILINVLVNENHVVMPLESKQSKQVMKAVCFADFHANI